MIPDDIEAFAADFAVADRIVERAEAGVTPQRLFADGEVLAFVRAFVAMRHLAATGAARWRPSRASNGAC